MGVYSLAIKDMTVLMTPHAAAILVPALREERPDVPLHSHTHDAANTSVTYMIAATNVVSDVVYAVTDAMSSLTSQLSLGAIAAVIRSTNIDAGFDPDAFIDLNIYWDNMCSLYAPFKSGHISGISIRAHSQDSGGTVY